MFEIIGQRIKDLREEKGLTQLELAKDLNAGRETIARWETGTRDLKTDALIQIAKYFEVSSDYLLGLSEYKTSQTEAVGINIGLSESNINNLKQLSAPEVYTDDDGETFTDDTKAKIMTEYLNKFLHSFFSQSVLNSIMSIRPQVAIAKRALNRINKSIEQNTQAALADCITVVINEKKINDSVSEVTEALNSIIKNVVAYNEVEKEFKDFTDEWYELKIKVKYDDKA